MRVDLPSIMTMRASFNQRKILKEQSLTFPRQEGTLPADGIDLEPQRQLPTACQFILQILKWPASIIQQPIP